jgi:hypothetical protein
MEQFGNPWFARSDREKPLSELACRRKANHKAIPRSKRSRQSRPSLKEITMLDQDQFRRTASDAPVVKGDALRRRALVQCFTWTDSLWAAFFRETTHPVRSAAAFAGRQVEQGWLETGVFELQEVRLEEQPLWTSSKTQAPDCDALAYRLERRFSPASKPTRIYWPGLRFAKQYGTWTGAHTYPCPHKLSHDVLITAVWLKLLELSPVAAVQQWVPERYLQWLHRRGEWLGPIPDGLLVDGQQLTAIEVGGKYSAAWIRHHLERFTAAGWNWQLW